MIFSLQIVKNSPNELFGPSTIHPLEESMKPCIINTGGLGLSVLGEFLPYGILCSCSL